MKSTEELMMLSRIKSLLFTSLTPRPFQMKPINISLLADLEDARANGSSRNSWCNSGHILKQWSYIYSYAAMLFKHQLGYSFHVLRSARQVLCQQIAPRKSSIPSPMKTQ